MVDVGGRLHFSVHLLNVAEIHRVAAMFCSLKALPDVWSLRVSPALWTHTDLFVSHTKIWTVHVSKIGWHKYHSCNGHTCKVQLQYPVAELYWQKLNMKDALKPSFKYHECKLGQYFIGYTLLVLGWTPFYLQNYLNFLVKQIQEGPQSFVDCTFMMQISCYIRCPIGLRSGNS